MILQYRAERNQCAEILHYRLTDNGYSVSLSSVKRVLKRYGCSRYSRWKKWHQYPPRPLAEKPGILVEIDTIHDRLDIKDEYIRKCVGAGVKMSIDSDAHSRDHFKMLEHGIAQARRGWAEKGDIINAWPAEKMLSMLKK